MTLDAARGFGALATADLTEHLPPDSALRRETEPALAWREDAYILSAIEYELRMLLWALGDPKRRGDRPEPMPTPADAARRKRSARPASRAEMRRVADRLGIPEDRR